MNIREDLKAYVDGELSPEREAEVRVAIEADLELQGEVEFMKALGFEIKRLSRDPQPVGYEVTLKAISRGRRPWWTPLNLSVATVALLMVVGGATVLFPIFAQPKEASRATAELAASRRLSRDSGLEERAANSMAGRDHEQPQDAWGRAGEQPREDWAESKSKSEALNGAGATNMPSLDEPSKDAVRGGKGMDTQGSVSNTLPGPAPNPVSPTASMGNRMVVQTAQIEVKVPDAKKALSSATGMAQGLGGFVQSSGISGSQGGLPVASVTLRVPQPKFAVAMQRIRDMGEVLSETSSGDDVTAQYADVDARVKVLRLEEEQYRTILGQTRKISDILEVKDRLGRVRQEIESLDAQRVALKDQAKLSTISATFEQSVSVGKPEEPTNWLEDIWATAVNALSSVGVFLGKVGVFLLVFSPVWLPVVFVAWWLNRRAARMP